MNTITVKHIGASLVLVGLLAACNKAPVATSNAAATDAGTPSATAAPAESAPPAQAPETAEVPTQIPGTTDAIWQAIDQQSAQLKAAIQANTLKDVHHKAFAIRDLVAALPERSKSLPADEQAKLQSAAKFVATLADRLDATGDANDQTGSQANYDKLMTVLNGITRTK